MHSDGNKFFHNNFINNIHQVEDDSDNIWDNGYPSGGNFWSDYSGVDVKSGSKQDKPGADGLGDTNYTVNAINKVYDNYPLMRPWPIIPMSLCPSIELVSPANNSVIKPGSVVQLNVTGDSPVVTISINGGAAADLPAPFAIGTGNWPDGNNVVNVTASDANGTKTVIFTFIVDSISPVISLLSPANNTLVRVGWVLDFDVQDVNFASANYTRDGTVLNLGAPFDVDTTGWSDGFASVTVRVLDQAGNEAVKVFGFDFDGTRPRVTSTIPANAAIGIPVNAQVVIMFSERMNKSATESSISMMPAVTVSIFNWNADWSQLTVKFAANMTQSTNYRLTVGIIARDMVGNTVNGTYTMEFTTWLDTDHDGLPNNQDQDDDGDGYIDPIDAFPLDPNEWLDTDGDGIGNNADLDDDNDGVPDTEDAFPLERYESRDSDGDGVGDNQDAFPNDPTETTDSDGDGAGDNEDFLPYFDNNLFYSLIVLAPCVTAVLIALIVTSARRHRAPKGGGRQSGGHGKADESNPEIEAVEEPRSPPKKRVPDDPMAPPPED